MCGVLVLVLAATLRSSNLALLHSFAYTWRLRATPLHPCFNSFYQTRVASDLLHLPPLYFINLHALKVLSLPLTFNADLATSVVTPFRAPLRIDCHLLLLTQLYPVL